MSKKTIFLSIIVLFFISNFGMAQVSVPGSFGSMKGNYGSFDYSLGQVFFNTIEGSTGSVTQGIHQPIEIYPVGIADHFALNNEDILMQAYPNPTTDHISIEITDFMLFPENFSYALFSVNGEMMESKVIDKEVTKVDLSNINGGNYFLRIIRDNQAIKTFKITKH